MHDKKPKPNPAAVFVPLLSRKFLGTSLEARTTTITGIGVWVR